MLSLILLDWRVWHKAEEAVWKKVLWSLEKLLSSDDPLTLNINHEAFAVASAIVKILLIGKVRGRGGR